MKNNPLKQLGTLGQSIWLDYIRRDLIAGGELRRLIEEDGLRGMTSNPAIFEKAIAGSQDYDEDIRATALEGKDAQAIYEALSQHDVQSAADEFRPLYDRTDGTDGYVSLEVNPHLAHDTQGTTQEARRLWDAMDRPNVLIKVPATTEGLPAIRQLISEGNSDGAADVVIQFTEKTEDFNQTEFRRGIGQIMASQQDQSLQQTNVGKSLLELSRTAADNGLFVASELTLLELEMKEFVGGLPSRLDRIMDAIINYLAIPVWPFSAFYPRRREGSGW